MIVKQIGSGDIIFPSIFNYGKHKMITWDYSVATDDEGNEAGYNYTYIELDYRASDGEVVDAMKSIGLSNKQIEDILDGRKDKELD